MIGVKLKSWLAGLGAKPRRPDRGSRSVDIPPAWIDYAGLMRTEVRDWLSQDAEGDAEHPLDAFLATPAHPMAVAGPATPVTLNLSVKVASDGTVSSVDLASTIDAARQVALMGMLIGRRLSAPPPAGFLQPVHLRLTIAPDLTGQTAT